MALKIDRSDREKHVSIFTTLAGPIVGLATGSVDDLGVS